MGFNYRPEIDGLRAVAVFPVLLFHAGFETFGGGFVGVDVFFVISGYLITSIIIFEQQTSSFTLINFYERRARRILPALFVVMAVCLPFSWMWMFPNELKDFARSLMAVSVFGSNILFWRESGYFVTAAEMKPFLHTWSLAVEEQFYILFPLFLILLYRFGRRWLVWALFILMLISLGTAQWGSLNKPIPNFYLLPTRAWELLLGSLLALVSTSSSPLPSNVQSWRFLRDQWGSVIGFLLIIFSVIFFNRETPHPSVYTLIPVMGTACIILFAGPTNFVGRLLRSPAIVFIGSISYALYLWHQPLFAFARYRTINEPSPAVFLGLILTAVMLATFSLYLVEKPFRDSKIVSRRQILALTFVGTLCFFLLGTLWFSKSGMSDRFSSDLVPKFFPEKTNEGTACQLTELKIAENIQYCFFGDISTGTHIPRLFSKNLTGLLRRIQFVACVSIRLIANRFRIFLLPIGRRVYCYGNIWIVLRLMIHC
jgi:peptidoglycan/LPS O-acetylase OafA/YrhL